MSFVKCIDNSKFEEKLTVGEIYKVIEEAETYYFLHVPTYDVHVLFSKHRFEKVLNAQ